MALPEGVNSSSVDDDDIVVDTVELLSREDRLEYLCLDLKLPHPFLNSPLRGARKKGPVAVDILLLLEDDLEFVSEMTRTERDGNLVILDRGLLLLWPALWGDCLKLGVLLSLVMFDSAVLVLRYRILSNEYYS